MLETYEPFTDQLPFPEEMEEVVAVYDTSCHYELDTGAIFKTKGGMYRGVVVSGCS